MKQPAPIIQHKRLIMILFLITMSFTPTASAEMEFSVSLSYPHYLSEYMGVSSIASPKVTLGTQTLYLWGSYESGEMRSRVHSYYGQLEIFGTGIGAKKGPFFIELGYYFPDAQAEGIWNHGERFWEAFAESMAIRLHPLTIGGNRGIWRGKSKTYWPKYSYTITEEAIGGSVGGKLNIVDYDAWKIDAFCAYRFLKFKERMRGFNPEHNKGWTIRDTRDVSALMIGINLTF